MSIYIVLRRFFFWFFLLGFLILTPIIVSYSLGYKFDIQSRKLQKTGAISIKSAPKDVQVFIDGTQVSDATPYISRSLLPKKYQVLLQKDKFYPYQVTADVRSAMVSEVDATLIPQMHHVDKVLLNFNVYRFFLIQQLFGRKIIAFTDKGIYECNENLETPQKIADLKMDEALVATIIGLKEYKNQLVFWNQNQVWLVVPPKSRETEIAQAQLVLDKGEMIKDLFWGMKGKYLIVHDALRVIAIDTKNPSVTFPIYTLNSLLAGTAYDPDSETLYIKDRLPNSSEFTLFRVSLLEVINEKNDN